jgi:hypothetical protein
MTTENPTLQALLKNAIESRLTDLHVALPGIVQTYDAAKQTADVQPALQKKYADGAVTNLPLISNVPVMFPRSSVGHLHFPLKRGDQVLLVFVERSVDIFRQKGGVVDPEDFRKHHLSDAIALPGFYPDSGAFAGVDGQADLVSGDAKLTLKESGEILMGGAASTPDQNVVLGKILQQYLKDVHAQLAAILDVLIAGDHVLTTSPGNPTGPNPAKALLLTNAKAALEALKASPISDSAVLSDILFTEKG